MLSEINRTPLTKKIVFLKKLLAIISLPVFLQACVAAGVAGVAATGAVLVYERKNISASLSDSFIASTIRNRIYADKALFANNHIVVTVDSGNVLLIGQARNEGYKQRAEDIVKNIEGVRRLYDEISIAEPTSIGRQLTDSANTTRLRSIYLFQTGINPSAIQVVTENGTVYLMGTVTPEEADKATNIAREMIGVKKVVKVFQYIN